MIECPPQFKIHPCPDLFPKPPMDIGHYPHYLDYSIPRRTGVRGITELSYSLESPPRFEELQKFPIPDDLVLACDANARLDEIVDLVNALSDKHVVRYGSYQSWFIELGGEHTIRYGQECYHHPDVGIPDKIDPTPHFEAYDEIAIRIDREPPQLVRLQHLIRNYFEAPADEAKRLFRNACRIACRSRRLASFDLSVSFVLLVSSVESLIHIEHLDSKAESCADCGQAKYSVVRKYRDFLDKYCFDIDKRTKNRLYTFRSALVHQGQVLPFDEQDSFYVESAVDLKRRYDATASRLDYYCLRRAVTACFRTFLLRNFAEADGPDGVSDSV